MDMKFASMYSTYKGRRWTISSAIVVWKKLELWWFQQILSLFLMKAKQNSANFEYYDLKDDIQVNYKILQLFFFWKAIVFH